MIKLTKYVIIVFIVLIFSITNCLVIYAAPETLGPGEDLPENPNWRISQNDYLGNPEFWASFAPIHFGVNVDARLKPGDNSGSDVIYVDRTEGKLEGAEAVKGYGLYQFILEKHMVGYLYYLRNKVNDEPNTSIVKTPGSLFTPTVYYKPREACKHVADLLMSSAYSVANQDLLHTLLKDIVNQNSAEDIKNWQSDFWYKAFGSEAYSKFSSIGIPNGVNGASIISGHERDFRGVVLSIMSDRYMKKSLQNKTNLRLNVDVGDLWPFLVYTTSDDNGVTTKWEYDKDNDPKTPNVPTTYDDLIRGIYYYMVYYEYKYDYEGDIELDEDVIYNSTKADMFVREYEELTHKRFIELEGKALDDFYQTIRRIRRTYKGKGDNGALFGEEEDYSINSDVTYSQAMNNIKRKMEQPPFNQIFGYTLSSDHVARTYLMAKNIAENHRLTNQNAQYDIGSNILQRTPGGNDNTILLTDLQKIKLNRSDNGTFPDDADKDGILDGNEMGTYKRVDITGFVEYMLKAESGLSDVSTLMENYKNNIRTANNDTRKKNLVESQKDIDVVNDRIIVYLMGYTSNPIMKDTDFDGIDDGYGYQDRDCTIFVNKNGQNDPKPRDNKLEGKVTMSNGTDFNVETHMDYRYFFMDEYNYYDELAEMSLILSQSVYNRNNLNLTNLNSLNEKIDARLINRYLEADDEEKRSLNNYDYKTNYAIGHHYVEYSKDNSANNYIKKMIVPIAIPGMTEISDARSYSDLGEPEWTKNTKIGEEQHNVKSYEVYAEMIKYDIDDYIRENHLHGDYKRVYWVTGYKEGGAIANILAAKLRDMGVTVYAYTFGAPMTIYNNPDEPGYTKTGYSARYDCIFNVVNEDDAYAYIMPQQLGFSRYGMTCFGEGSKLMGNGYTGMKASKEAIVDGLNKVYKGEEKNTRKKTYESNKTYLNLQNVIKRMICAIDRNRNNKVNNEDDLDGFLKRYRNVKTSNLSTFITALESKTDGINTNYNRVKRAGQEDVYYKIAENMDNADITNVVNLYDKKEHRLRVATGSDLYERYPNYHALNNIDINNPVPSIFQDAEVWSQFRYGITYNEDANDTIDHPNDTEKGENEKRKVRKYVNSWPTEVRNQYYELKRENKQLNNQIKNVDNNRSLNSQQKTQLKQPLNAQIQANKQLMNNIVATYNVYFYGTFWESACGVTSAAIVLSYLSDKQITPIDIRDRLENKTPTPEDYRPGSSGTSHATIKNIAELYGYQCDSPMVYESPRDNESESDKRARESRNSVKVANVVKELLRGNPVIAICKKGEFTAGGHYIVIAGVETDQVNDLKRQKGIATISDATLKETKWNEAINNLTYNELSNLRIYVLDPRYKHQAHPGNGKQATITYAWNINTFSYGGAGNPEKFWIYKKGNNNINLGTGVSETDLFDFNRIKYPDDYIEYFDPQGPDDTDEFCNSNGSVKPVGSFEKLDGQKWR